MGGGGSSFMNVVKWADPTYYADQDKAFGQSVSKPKEGLMQDASKVASVMGGGTPSASAPGTPKSTNPVTPVERATAEVKGSASVAGRRKAVPTRTTFTQPLGIGGMASTTRKLLLGQ